MIVAGILLAVVAGQITPVEVPVGSFRLAWVVAGRAPQVLELHGVATARLTSGDGCLAVVGAATAPRWMRLSLPQELEKVRDLWRGEAAASITGTFASEDVRSFPPVVRWRRPSSVPDGCWAALGALGLTEFQVGWDGSFTASPMPAGAWRLELTAAYHRAVEGDVTLGPGETRRLGTVPLAPLARLSVRVEANGASPPFRLGAERWMGTSTVPGEQEWRPVAETTIDKDTATLDLEPGRYRFTLRGGDGVALQEQRELTVGADELILRLDPIVVSGTVQRGDTPVAGANLAWAGAASRAEVVSRDDGGFEVSLWQGGRYMVTVEAPDLSPEVVLVDLGARAAGDHIERDLVLAARILDGVVRGAPGMHPLAGAALDARQDVSGGQVFTSLTADGEGRFRLPLKQGGNLRLDVDAEGYLSTTRTFAGEPPDGVLEIVLEPGVTVSGHVLDATGAPIPGAWVAEGPPDPRGRVERSAATDATGGFTLTCRPESVLWVVSAGRAIAWAKAQPEVTLVLGAPPAASELEVVLPGGKPAARVPISFATSAGALAPLAVLDRAARLQQRTVRTDEAGRIHVGTMPAGLYTAVLLSRQGAIPLGTVRLPTAPVRLEVGSP